MVPFTSQSRSQLLEQSGTLNLAAVTSTSSAFSLASGAALEFNTGDTRTFDAATTMSGPGSVYWQGGTSTFAGTITAPVVASGGTFTLNSAATQSIPTLTMSSGTINGTAAINLT